MKTRCFIFILSISAILNSQNIPLYVGTYTSGADSEGVYCFDFNTKTGKLTNKRLAIKIENPSFLSYSSNRNFLYVVSEVDNYNNSNSGFVSAFSVLKSGKLQFINSVSSNGAHPCHIELNSKNVAVSNYSGGTISIHKMSLDGGIKPAHQIINHNTPQEKSHAHSSKFINDKLFIADLGRNFLAQYVNNDGKYFLKENYTMGSKSGPRHFEITKKGDFIYVINEYASTVVVLKKEEEKYFEIQNHSTLDKGFKGENYCADIHLSKNQNYLYGSNRGENSIVVFKRNTLSGTITKIQSIYTQGNWPRHFTISPNGKFLLVANQKSKNISVYKITTETGKLLFLHSAPSPTPVHLLF